MALLGNLPHFMIAFAFLSVHPGFAKELDAAVVRTHAWKMTQACNLQGMEFWGKELRKVDQEQGILYEIFRLQLASSLQESNPAQNSKAFQWKWAVDGEVWKDEENLELST